MSRETNIAAQERLGEGINSGNADVVYEVFADDVVDHDPAPDQQPGPEGFEEFFKTLGSAFPDAEVTVERLVADDENVAIAYTLTGTHEGDFHGVAPTASGSRRAGCRSPASPTGRSSSAGAARMSSASSRSSGRRRRRPAADPNSIDQPHELPASGAALTGIAISATLHCLTGCAIGEVSGMAIGTALGLSNWPTVGLAVVLAFLFGYSLTSLPLLRAGFTVAAVIPIALASDTVSIAVMEVVDNVIVLLVPGSLDAGLGNWLFWGSLAVALVVAGAFAVPVNRWLIARGKGHAVVHETGVHGGPSPKLVGAIAAVAAVFGTVVLVAEAAPS